MALITTLLSTSLPFTDYSGNNDLIGQVKAAYQQAITAGAQIAIISDVLGDTTHSRVLTLKIGDSSHYSVYSSTYFTLGSNLEQPTKIDGVTPIGLVALNNINLQNFTLKIMFGASTIASNTPYNQSGGSGYHYWHIYTKTASGFWVRLYNNGILYSNLNTSNPCFGPTPNVTYDSMANTVMYQLNVFDPSQITKIDAIAYGYSATSLKENTFYKDSVGRHYYCGFNYISPFLIFGE